MQTLTRAPEELAPSADEPIIAFEIACLPDDGLPRYADYTLYETFPELATKISFLARIVNHVGELESNRLENPVDPTYPFFGYRSMSGLVFGGLVKGIKNLALSGAQGAQHLWKSYRS